MYKSSQKQLLIQMFDRKKKTISIIVRQWTWRFISSMWLPFYYNFIAHNVVQFNKKQQVYPAFYSGNMH